MRPSASLQVTPGPRLPPLRKLSGTYPFTSTTSENSFTCEAGKAARPKTSWSCRCQGAPSGPAMTGSTLGLAALAVAGLWAYASFYTVKPEERSVDVP